MKGMPVYVRISLVWALINNIEFKNVQIFKYNAVFFLSPFHFISANVLWNVCHQMSCFWTCQVTSYQDFILLCHGYLLCSMQVLLNFWTTEDERTSMINFWPFYAIFYFHFGNNTMSIFCQYRNPRMMPNMQLFIKVCTLLTLFRPFNSSILIQFNCTNHV